MPLEAFDRRRDFLRTLYRQGRLTATELDGRLSVLKDLAAGKLRPSIKSQSLRVKDRTLWNTKCQRVRHPP